MWWPTHGRSDYCARSRLASTSAASRPLRFDGSSVGRLCRPSDAGRLACAYPQSKIVVPCRSGPLRVSAELRSVDPQSFDDPEEAGRYFRVELLQPRKKQLELAPRSLAAKEDKEVQKHDGQTSGAGSQSRKDSCHVAENTHSVLLDHLNRVRIGARRQLASNGERRYSTRCYRRLRAAEQSITMTARQAAHAWKSNSPALTPRTNSDHSCALKRCGAVAGFFESRMKTSPSGSEATSTQLEWPQKDEVR